MALSWTFRAHSEIGLVRKNNQDSGFVGRHLLLVADGMGGAAAGDLASAVAVDSIKSIDDEDAGPAETGAADNESGQRNLDLLSNSIFHANNRIADLVTADFTLEGMGTTVTAALLDHDQLSLAHIGDSRAYLWRDGRLERLTHDHSWVQSLVDEGKIDESEAAVHPHRSLLLKVLNGHPANEPDLTTLDLHDGDRLLFCSDGLCGFVEDDDLAEALAQAELDQVMTTMIEAAHAAGGLDNITIILAELSAATPTSGSEASLGAIEPQILGAAAEREIPSPETMVRGRLLPDDFASTDDDDDDELTDGELTDGDNPAAEDEDRYAPIPPARRRLLRPMVGVLVLVLVLAAGLGAGYAWSRTQFFVGNDSGQVTIFRGVSGAPAPLHLAQVYEVQQLPVSSLPPLYQQMVTAAIDVSDLGAARATVEQLQQAALACVGKPHGATAGSSPRATGTPGRMVSPKTSGSPTPVVTPKSSIANKSTAGTTTSVTASPGPSPTPTSSGVLPTGGQSC